MPTFWHLSRHTHSSVHAMPSNSNSKSKSGLKQYFSTIALGIKLSSFVKIPLIHDVPTMDKLTTQELNQLVLEEPASHIKQSTPLGHLLSVIFQSCKVQAPCAEDLQIPLSQIRYSNKWINHQFHQHEPTDFVDCGIVRWRVGTGGYQIHPNESTKRVKRVKDMRCLAEAAQTQLLKM